MLAVPSLRACGDTSYHGRPREPWMFTSGLRGAITATVSKTDAGVIKAGHAFRMKLAE